MDRRIQLGQTVEEIVNYASALDEYFDTLIYDREQHPLHFAFALSKKYGLNEDQLDEFKKVALRTFRAQEIVRYFEKRFGTDEEFKITDPEGLHRLVFKGRYVPKNMQAQSYNM